MWVEGKGGIDVSQYIRYRYNKDGGDGLYKDEDHYNYITYQGQMGLTYFCPFMACRGSAVRVRLAP